MTEQYSGPIPSDFNPASQTTSAYDDLFKSDMAKLADTLLKDDLADKQFQDFPLWISRSRSLKLTFFRENDIQKLEHLYEAEICRLMRRLSPSSQKYETYNVIAQSRIIFLANIRRSLGTTQGTINERLAFLTMQKLFTPLSEIAGEQSKKGGFWSRLLGR